MIENLNYRKLTNEECSNLYGKGAELGMGIITAFVVVTIVTVVAYKIFGSKKGDITLPGGFKFKFTTWK